MESKQLKKVARVPLNKRMLLGVMFIFFISGFAISQNLVADITSINKVYRSTKQMSLVFNLNMYESYQSTSIHFSQKGTIKKLGSNTIQSFDNSECLNTSDYSIVIDKESKEVVYSPKKTTFSVDELEPLVNIDSLAKFCKSISYKKIDNEHASYIFQMPADYPEYNQVAVFFNTKTFLLDKLVFYCNEDDISINNEKEKLSKARIEINYLEINLDPKFIPQDFTYEKYLSRSGKTFKLNPDFKNYNLTVLSF